MFRGGEVDVFFLQFPLYDIYDRYTQNKQSTLLLVYDVTLDYVTINVQ